MADSRAAPSWGRRTRHHPDRPDACGGLEWTPCQRPARANGVDERPVGRGRSLATFAAQHLGSTCWPSSVSQRRGRDQPRAAARRGGRGRRRSLGGQPGVPPRWSPGRPTWGSGWAQLRRPCPTSPRGSGGDRRSPTRAGRRQKARRRQVVPPPPGSPASRPRPENGGTRVHGRFAADRRASPSTGRAGSTTPASPWSSDPPRCQPRGPGPDPSNRGGGRCDLAPSRTRRPRRRITRPA